MGVVVAAFITFFFFGAFCGLSGAKSYTQPSKSEKENGSSNRIQALEKKVIAPNVNATTGMVV